MKRCGVDGCGVGWDWLAVFCFGICLLCFSLSLFTACHDECLVRCDLPVCHGM